jgi:hypothetical protein
MMTLKQLKAKYSGQTVPEWELIANGLKGDAPAPAKRGPGRPPKVEDPAPESEGEGE